MKTTILIIILSSCLYCIVDNFKITEELRKLNSDDQYDRKFMFVEGEKLDISKLMLNDSKRLLRVIELDSLDLIVTIADKYYANLIFWHSRDEFLDGKLIYCDKVIQYCNEVLNEDFESEANFEVLKYLKKELEKEAKGSNIIFTNEQIKKDFENFIVTAQNYKNEFFKPDSLEKENIKIATDSLENEDYLKRLKIKVYADTKKNLMERYGNSLTDEMIEEAVNMSYENLINTGKALQNYYKEEKAKRLLKEDDN